MAGKEGIFVILDVGKSMNIKYQDTEETRLNFGIESIRQLIRTKLLFNVKRDQIGIILMGREGDEAENINIHSDLDFPNIEMLEKLNEIEAESEEDNGDIFLCIDFAIDEFISKYGKKKYEKKIFLITDGEAVSKFSKNKIEELAERINEHDIKVNIICVGFNEELDKDDEDGREGGAWIYKEEWEYCRLFVWTDSTRSWNNMYVSIGYCESPGRKRIKKENRIKLDCLEEEPDKDNPYGWEFLHPDIRNWDRSITKEIVTKRVVKDIIKKFEQILNEIEEKKIVLL